MNLLLQAAQCANRDVAVSAILESLGIDKRNGVAIAILPDPRDWKRMTVAQRLSEIASWLTAECNDLIPDDGAVIVPIRGDCQGENITVGRRG